MIAFKAISELPYKIQLQLKGKTLPDPSEIPDGDIIEAFYREGSQYYIAVAKTEEEAFFILSRSE